MMKTKVMIKAIFPAINKEYDIKIPINEVVWKVNKLIVKAIYDLNGIKIDIRNDNFILINKITGIIYENNDIIIDTDIRNGTEIIFLKEVRKEKTQQLEKL